MIHVLLYVSSKTPLDSKLIENSNAESPRIQMTKAVTIISVCSLGEMKMGCRKLHFVCNDNY